MKIHEYQAAEILKKGGIPVVSGEVASELSEARLIADKIGYPVVLKSQVLVGGRGKAGGIKVVKNKEELEKIFPALRKLSIKGYPVNKILIVKAIDIKKEFYVAVTIDHAKDDVVLIASSAGGVEIEETAKTNPQAIKKFYLEQRNIDQSRLSEFINTLFESPDHRKSATLIFQKLIDVFFQNDCSLAEINPLVVDEHGQLFAADAKMNFDDNALYRHEDIQKLQDLSYEDPDELEAMASGLSFVKLEGDVGCIVNGAGLAMATMDIIKLSGGQPANFLDVGGSSNPQKVLSAMKIILRNQEIKAIFVNIFGGITRCDDIAVGLLKAMEQIKPRVPLVVRLTGTNEKEAKELLAKSKIAVYSSMRDAVNKVVELVR